MTLPNFLIIGAQKAASTWLTVNLNDHPEIYLPQSEIHFFNAHYDRGIDWYAKQFRPGGERAIGEKSPLYLSHAKTPKRIRATLGPDVRLIASLRQPVDRAYSAYWHSIKGGRISAEVDFQTAFRERLPDLKENGEYWRHLSSFSACFSSDLLLIQIFEDAMSRPQATLRECVNFLGVDGNFEFAGTGSSINRAPKQIRRFSRQAWALSRRMNRLPPAIRVPLKSAGRAAFSLLPKLRDHERLDADLRHELTLEFKPGIHRLEAMLDRDLSAWYAD